jgi:NTE family protein
MVQERLINWGYAVCDAALRQHVDPGLSRPTGFPYPASGV